MRYDTFAMIDALELYHHLRKYHQGRMTDEHYPEFQQKMNVFLETEKKNNGFISS